jgi:hypothetical protein
MNLFEYEKIEEEKYERTWHKKNYV